MERDSLRRQASITSSILRLVLVVTATLGVLAAPPAAAGPPPECRGEADSGLGDRPWLVPFEFEVSSDPVAQQRSYYEFIWRTFVALNWPAQAGVRGRADVSAGIFGNDPRVDRVWETFPGPLEVFLPVCRWDDYPTWSELCHPSGAEGSCDKDLRHRKIPADFGILVNQPGTSNLSLTGEDDFPTGPLVDRQGNYVIYQVGINRAYFEYLRRHEYYDRSKQIEAVRAYLSHPLSPGAFQPLPSGYEPYVQELPPHARQGMIEVKAAWRDLEGVAHQDRYVRRYVDLDVLDTGGAPTRGRRLMGLVALHILRYTPRGMVAATFEQVDNVAVGHSAPEGLRPSFNDGAPPSAVESLIGFENQGTDDASEIPRYDPPHPPQEAEIVSVYRMSPIPEAVQKVNAEFQAKLYQRSTGAYSPLAFYQLIGTQNRHPGGGFTDRETNGHEGPKTGVYTNANNLINTALESYTQRNFSCIMCHVAARPLGVTQASFGIDRFKILSFLMRRACPNPDASYCECGEASAAR